MNQQPEPERISRTLVTVKFIPRERCDNCRTQPAVVTVTRRHYSTDFTPHVCLAGSYEHVEKLCQPCANEVVREESYFLDSIVDDGKKLFLQSNECIATNNDLITREDCGCNDCLDELVIYHQAGEVLENG